MTRKKGKNLVEEKPPHFECTKCGTCCRDDSILITVTGGDIKNISSVLDLSPEEILRALDFYITSDDRPAPLGLKDIPSPITERGKALIALRKMENGECIFLKDDLCMIHTFRPVVCQSFPFVFSIKGGEIMWGLSAKKEICPGLGTGPLVSVDELGSLAELVLREIGNYHVFVDEWNQNGGGSTLNLIRTILSDARF
ncbi:MAG: YkgJ family cysteine cluster protein [Candidatus Thorarchaeota archaeon]|nr:YkgJ family cysteine cluster protein [Candidatus Thorarchaeota archaeon]